MCLSSVYINIKWHCSKESDIRSLPSSFATFAIEKSKDRPCSRSREGIIQETNMETTIVSVHDKALHDPTHCFSNFFMYYSLSCLLYWSTVRTFCCSLTLKAYYYSKVSMLGVPGWLSW